MTPTRPLGFKIFPHTVYVRIPPAADGCDSAVCISEAEFTAAAESDCFLDDRYESWLPSGRIITADSLRDHRHRLNPKRPMPSPIVAKGLLHAQAELITIRRLLGHIAAGTEGFEALHDSIAWLREAADCFEQITRAQADSVALVATAAATSTTAATIPAVSVKAAKAAAST